MRHHGLLLRRIVVFCLIEWVCWQYLRWSSHHLTPITAELQWAALLAMFGALGFLVAHIDDWRNAMNPGRKTSPAPPPALVPTLLAQTEEPPLKHPHRPSFEETSAYISYARHLGVDPARLAPIIRGVADGSLPKKHAIDQIRLLILTGGRHDLK